MPHATEGQLHALLDGAKSAFEPGEFERISAHLETCADCQAKLETERSIRGDSMVLLDRALGGAIEAPPFAAILERAEAEDAGASTPRNVGPSSSGAGRRGPERLAWAATVVIALGAGWFGHALLRGGVEPMASAPAGELALEESFAAADEAVASTAEPVNVVDAAGPQEAAPQAPSSDVESEANARFRAQAETPAEQQLAEAMPPAPTSADPTAESADRLEIVAAPPRRLEADVAERENRPSTESPGERTAEVQLRQVQQDVPAAAVGRATAGSGDAAEGMAAFADDAGAWRSIRGEPERMLRIEGLDVLDYGIVQIEGVAHLGVRQRLPGGEVVRLVVLDETLGAEAQAADLADTPADADARRDADAAKAREPAGDAPVLNEVRAEVDGRRIQLSGPVAPDSLRSLVSRIRMP